MKVGMRVANVVPTVVLSSPLHHLMSRRYLMLHFTGRTSGRQYATPVAYARTSEGVVISTDSPWWRNLAAEPRVRLRLRGRSVAATAEVLHDEQAIAALRQLVDDVPGYWRPAGIARTNGRRVSDQALVDAVLAGRQVLTLRVGR